MLDATGSYVLLRPPCDWGGEVSLVRLSDAHTAKLAVQQSVAGFYGPEWLDLSVEACDPPQVSVLLVSVVDRKFRRCRLADQKWAILDEGPADAAMLNRVEVMRRQHAFVGEEVKRKFKVTRSPDGACVLNESVAPLAHRAELRMGQRVVLLSVQTDQLGEILGKFIGFLIYRGK